MYVSPTLFLVILDRVMKRVMGSRKTGTQWSMNERLEDLDYADDICVNPEILRYGRKAKATKRGSRMSWDAQ